MIDTHLGGCVCGAVRYRVHGDPVVGTVCHCRFCQKRLASAFVAAVTGDMMIAWGGSIRAASAMTSGQRWVAYIR